MDEEKDLDFEVEALDPDVTSMMASLGLSMSDSDVSAVVTGETSIEDDDIPDPYEDTGDAPLQYQRQPQKKQVTINGKVWWDITELIGNSEEIAAMNTVLKPKESKIKKKSAFGDGIMRRPDRY